MKITRHNYEEYFILYMDNELSDKDRREVELFVKDNPDLQSELDVLFLSQLSADTTVVFPGKQVLLKVESSSINQDNYEGWLLSYIDNELAANEKTSVEQFIASRPAIKAELELLQKTKLQPDTIVFADKSSLYRREEKVRLIPINWRRIAIAASLVFAVGTSALVIFYQKEDEPKEFANINGKKAIPVEQIKEPAVKEEEGKNNQAAVDPIETHQEETPNNTKPGTNVQSKHSTLVVEKIVRDEIKEEKSAVSPEQKKSNGLPEPIYNPNINKVSPKDNPIAMVEAPVKDPLTKSKETSPETTVTPRVPDALYTSNTSSGSLKPVDENQPGKKNKLRGFFRKVTRTFEKNTNIKATDDEDRLLLGGLAIKL